MDNVSLGWTKPSGLFIELAEVYLSSAKKDLKNPKSKPIITADISYVDYNLDYNQRMPNVRKNKFRIELETGEFIAIGKKYEFLNGDYIIGQIELMVEEFFNKD